MTRANGVAIFSQNADTMQWSFGPAMSVQATASDLFPDYHSFDVVQSGIVLNGLKQKLADSIASCKTPTERFDRMTKIRDNLYNGVWSERGSSGSSDAAILVAAIVSVSGKSLEKITAYVAGKSKTEIAALMVSERYSKAVNEIRKARVASIDVDLDEIDDL